MCRSYHLSFQEEGLFGHVQVPGMDVYRHLWEMYPIQMLCHCLFDCVSGISNRCDDTMLSTGLVFVSFLWIEPFNITELGWTENCFYMTSPYFSSEFQHVLSGWTDKFIMWVGEWAPLEEPKCFPLSTFSTRGFSKKHLGKRSSEGQRPSSLCPAM